MIATAESPRTPWGVAWRTALALVIGVGVWAFRIGAVGDFPALTQVWFWVGDPAVGIAALVLVLVFVRRMPMLIALAAAAAVLVSTVAIGAALLALGSVATRRRWREIAVVAASDLVVLLFIAVPYPVAEESAPWWTRAAVMALGISVVAAAGIGLGQRRALLAGLRERAEQAEREQEARAEAARAAERNRIAHDMHDVLAHRISLVAMHAAALAFRDDVAPAEQAVALQTISENARLALGELRDVLGVLRESTGADPAPPQPSLADVARIVDEARSVGAHVELVEAVDGVAPTAPGQAAFCVVREALTNARKHAPGAPVVVSIAGEAGEGLAVRVRNAAPQASVAPELPGTGLGLVAMRERVERLGGRMTHGPTGGGGFEVAVWLPWAT